jgi:hypothetical protein
VIDQHILNTLQHPELQFDTRNPFHLFAGTAFFLTTDFVDPSFTPSGYHFPLLSGELYKFKPASPSIEHIKQWQ